MALTQIDDRGLKTPIDLLDNEKIRLGTGNDLELYHDASHSRIVNGTGNLLLDNSNGTDMYLNSGNDIYIRPQGSENGIRVIGDGAVDLYYDNALRLNTMTEGAKVKRHGGGSTTLYVEGAEGGSAILDMYADDGDDNADKFRLNASSDGTFYMQNYANNGWQSNITYTGAGNVELYHNGTKRFETTANGVTISGNDTGSYVKGDFTFDNQTNAGKDCWWDQSDNRLGFNDDVKIKMGDGADLQLYHDGSNNHIVSAGTGTLRISDGDNSTAFETVSTHGNNVYQNFRHNTHGNTFIGTETDSFVVYTKDAGASSHSIRVNINSSGLAFHSDTADANRINDYEEGTWTPDSRHGSFTTYTANYIKIGNVVTAQCYGVFSAGTSTNEQAINGFPFDLASGNRYHTCGINSDADTGHNLIGQLNHSGNVSGGSSAFLVFAKDSNVKATQTEMAGHFILFSITYVII